MERQDSKSLGALFYDNTPPSYVPPPVKEIKELSAAKEDTYIKAKDSRNAIDEALVNMKYLPQSKDIYDNLRSKTDEVLNGINSENYEDHLLDTTQLASDIKGKLGGTKLVEQAQNLGVALKEIDDAYDKKDINDPEFRDWKKQKTIENTKGLKKNPDGTFTSTQVTAEPFAKDVDLDKRINEIMTGWESDGTYEKDTKTGMIKVNRPVAGYLSTTANTFINPEDLYKAAKAYLQDQPDAKAFIQDRAQFNNRNIEGSVQDLFPLLSDSDKEKITGKKDASVEDVFISLNTLGINPKSLIDRKEEDRISNSTANFAANKFGFSKEVGTLHDDTMFNKFLDTEQANAKIKKQEESNASVSFESFKTQIVLNPFDAVKLQSNKANLEAKRTSLQAQTNQYEVALREQERKNKNVKPENRDKTYSQDEFEKLQKQQAGLDNDIADTVRQQNEIRKTTRDIASKVKVDLDEEYKNNWYPSVQLVKDNNTKLLTLASNDIKLDVTNQIYTKNGEDYIKINGTEHRLEDGYSLSDTLGTVKKEGDKYIYSSPNGKGFLYKEIEPLVFNNRGEINPTIQGVSKLLKDSYYLPTKEEYYDMTTKAFANKEGSNNAVGLTKHQWEGETTANGQNKKLLLSPNILKSIDKVNDAQPDIQYTIGKPITTMLVVGDKPSSNLAAFNKLERANAISLHKTPDQYSVKDLQGKNIPIQTYVENLGVDYHTDIDWDKVEAKLAMQTDREFGQNYAIYLPLTDAAKKEYGKTKLNKILGNDSDGLKLVAINTIKNVPTEQKRIRSTILQAYSEMKFDDYGEAIKKQMSSLYFNNTEDGVDFYKKNLYTLSAGHFIKFSLKGDDTQYKVTTTAKDANNSDLLNVNFHLARKNRVTGEDEVVAVNNLLSDTDPNKTQWMNADEVEEDSSFSKATFDTPEDIGSHIGYAMMQKDFKTNKANNTVNVYEKYVSNSNYIQNSNSIQDVNYSSIKRETKEYYHGNNPVISLNNYSSGTNDRIVTRVNREDLVNYAQYYPDNIKKGKDGNRYPYINKEVFPSLSKIIDDYNVEITGGFRGEDTHSHQPESDPNGLHKYGYAVDIAGRSDTNEGKKGLQLLNDLQHNSELAKKYGVLKANLHNVGGVNHVHLEFNPNK